MRAMVGWLGCAALSFGLAACGVGQASNGSDDTADDSANLELGSRVVKMPMSNGVDAFAQNTASSAHLTYYGGPVISNVRIYTVYWGSSVGSQSQLNQFYGDITNSAYLDWLSEYNTPSQKIGRGSFAGSVVDTSPPSGSTITDTAIQKEISRLITAGKLPPNTDGNNLYMVHFPAGVTITQGGESSCNQFCAYHGTFKRSGVYTYYGVIPDLSGGCASGCGGSTKFNNTTSVASHEMIEAVTDAAVGLATSNASPLAWYDSQNGEIGDICNAEQGQVAGYTVQKEWSNSKDACILTNPGASTGGSTGSGSTSGGTTTGSTGSTSGGSTGGTTGGVTTLEDGVALSNLSGSQGSHTYFALDVPAGATNLTFKISGGSGNANLYVKFGTGPTGTSYDCRSIQSTNSDSCTIAAPQAGTWYVMLLGNKSYSGVTLVGSYDGGSSGGTSGGTTGGTGGSCQTCTSASQCGSGMHCLENSDFTGPHFCAPDCTADHNSCPSGYACVQLSSSWGCRPDANTCQ